MRKVKGLTNEQVQNEMKLGHMNISPKPLVKSYRQIVIEHVFNLFNAYNFVIAVALIMVQAWSSLFFVVIVTSNTVIRIYQEIRSRNMVAKLNLIISPKTKVLRDDQIQEIDNEEIVLSDVIYLETGNQISADSIVLDTAVEVDESLLTGEVDPVLKRVGDHLLSGSFIVSGACHAEVEHVGIDNYATKIANEARNRKPVISELVTFFNKVTKFTSFLVLPLSILMLYQALIVRDESMTMAIVNTSTALLGMLPKGLVLLTSVSMAASIVRLGKKEVLVQEMFSIETLSHADVLCLDKTGTLTQGKMEVQDLILFDHKLPYDINDVMSSFVSGSLDNNATFQTLSKYFQGNTKYDTKDRVSFSSARKWSASFLENVGTIIVGAPEFIIPDLVMPQSVEVAKQKGARVLLVAHHPDFETFQDDLKNAIPMAAIVILDPLRADAKETIDFFRENDVLIKVISGDNPVTVSALAAQAGVENSSHYLDATTLQTDEDIENAIKVAQAKKFINEKEKGLNESVSQGGTNFSGGQKQRLAIARALVRKADVYIFDDSFSALDFKTDVKVRSALKKYTKDSLVIIVGQRVSSIMNADKIIVLDEGKVVGQGTHSELLNSCQVYQEIVKSQLDPDEVKNTISLSNKIDNEEERGE